MKKLEIRTNVKAVKEINLVNRSHLKIEVYILIMGIYGVLNLIAA